MNTLSASLLLMFCIPAVILDSTQHTGCYYYFLKKDGCVFSAQDPNERCKAPPKDYSDPVRPFSCPSNLKRRSTASQLGRRYDTTNPSFPIASGTGICGTYDSTKELGVCLWSGAEQTNPTPATAGWLNGPMTANCGKHVYIQRKGHPETVQYAKVVDGCSFDATTDDVGCFQIGLSIQLFNSFNPTAEEQRDGKLYNGITWDFNNLDGKDPAQGPV